MSNTKLYILLAKTDALAVGFKNSFKNFITFFKNSQGAFSGVKHTYVSVEGTIDEPKRRGVRLIQTTVKEKLDWLSESSKEYLNALFEQEATNASGEANAELIVEGESWGYFSSLELLRLKGIISNGDFKNMYATIPVRSDAEEWSGSMGDTYGDREVWEGPKLDYTNKTSQIESYILPDPNIDKLGGKGYTPQLGQKNTTVILGEGTQQEFTGMWSQRQKAETLRKISILQVAVIEALKKANDVDTSKSAFSSEKLFTYLHG